MKYNPYRKYCSAWWRYWLNLPGDVWEFLCRLYDYAPILWADRDFDFAYLLRLMRFKIKRMRKAIELNAVIAHAEDVIAEMAKADVLLRNVVDEDPDDEWSIHWSRWHTGAKHLNDPCAAPGASCRLALDFTRKREERNWRKLWAYFEKHMQGWWD